MNTAQATYAMRIFDQLPDSVKHKIYLEMLNLGLRISFGSVRWHSHIRTRIKQTKGELSSFYAALSNFTPDDVNQFLTAFSNQPTRGQ